MKQSLAHLQNCFHQEAEKLDMGGEVRATELEEVITSILDLPTLWHTHISDLDVTDRSKLDLAHLYYGLPAPDCDLRVIGQVEPNRKVRPLFSIKLMERRVH
jgi:hypothetical protein